MFVGGDYGVVGGCNVVGVVGESWIVGFEVVVGGVFEDVVWECSILVVDVIRKRFISIYIMLKVRWCWWVLVCFGLLFVSLCVVWCCFSVRVCIVFVRMSVRLRM